MILFRNTILTQLLVALVCLTGKANVTVTPANAGNCLNVSPGAYLPIGNIVITENLNNDFTVQTNTTLVLTAPTGFTFQFGTGSVTFTAARNISAASVSVTLTTITVTISVTGTNLSDQLTISGINARASATNLSGSILRKPPSGGTASIAGNATGAGVVHGTLISVGGSATATTIAAGNWNAPATWLGGTVPLCGDNVIINHALTANVATMVTNATINAGGNLIATNAVTVNGTFTITAGGTYTHNNTNSVASTVFKGTESFATTSNLIINNWHDANAPLAQFVTGNFGNITLNFNSATPWDQDGMFSPNKIKGTLTVSAGQVTMDDGTGATTSLTLQDVIINSTGSLIIAKGANRNLSLTTNHFTDNSTSAGLTALMYNTYGTLLWTCNGNLTLAHDFSCIEGTTGIHPASATINITGNISITSGKIDFVKYINGPLNLTVSGNTIIASNFGGWSHLADFNSSDVTFTTNNLSISGNLLGNYLQGSAGMSTFNILNDFTYNGTGMFSFANNAANFSSQVINVAQDFKVLSGNAGLAYTGGVSFLNINRDFILTGATTDFAGQFNPLSTANTSIIIQKNCSISLGEFYGTWNKGQLFFTVNGTLVHANAIFAGVYYPLPGNYGTATFTIDSLNYDGGTFYLFDSYITDGRTITTNFGNLIDINFLSATDKVFFITNSTNGNNPVLATNVTGSVVISGLTTGNFISSRGAGNETCNIGGSITVTGGTNSFVGSTAFSSQPHAITTTIAGNLNISNGSLHLSALSGNATVNVTGNVAITGGNLFLKNDNGPAVMTVTGNYTQSAGNFTLHNNLAITSAADTVKVNGAFSHTNGNFVFDNAAGTAGLATHVLVINGSSYTLGGTGIMRHANHLTSNTVFGQILFNRAGTTSYNRSSTTHDLQQVKQIISAQTTVSAAASLNPFLISSHQDNTAAVNNTLTINGILQAGTTQILARQQANFYSQLLVNAGGRLATAHTGGLYTGTATPSCINAMISGNNRMNYFLDANSTIEYNGVDNQQVTGIPNGIATAPQHKYGKLEINFTGTSNTEFVFPESDSEVFVRTQLVLTAGEFNLDTDHVKTNGGRSINLENGATTLRTAGFVRSETENASGILRWNITANGSYIVPFGNNSSAYIPLTYTQNSGSTGWIKFATYGTAAANNLPLPPTVTHVNSASGSNNSANTTDRYWYINTASNPNFSITFTATSAELSGINTARAQRWLPTVKGWEPKKGTQSNPTATSTLIANTTGISTWWTLASNSNPLPVDLLSFSATCQNNEALINWSTASQLNNDFFTVEKSSDANRWVTLIKAKGEGTVHTVTHYEIKDTELNGNLIYYRLSQTDFNGSTAILKTIAVKGCGTKSVELVDYTFLQNQLALNLFSANQSSLEIMLADINGKILARKMQTSEPGINKLVIDCSTISNGIYFIRIKSENQWISKKIIKL